MSPSPCGVHRRPGGGLSPMRARRQCHLPQDTCHTHDLLACPVAVWTCTRALTSPPPSPHNVQRLADGAGPQLPRPRTATSACICTK